MKKTYKNPEMEIIKISSKMQMLAGSDPELGGEYSGGDVLSNETEFDW